MAVPHKTKQYLLAIAKVLVLAITFGYIFYRLHINSQLDFAVFVSGIFSKGAIAGYFFLFFLFMATLNWYFEILKWKNLASTLREMDFKTALKQSLASLTVSLATPNRIGEYGAKAMFYPKRDRKKVMLLNLFSNSSQLAATLLFGVAGILYFLVNYNIPFSFGAMIFAVIVLIVVGFLCYLLRNKEVFLKGFSIANIFWFFQKLPNLLKLKICLFSIIRYMLFSFMFYGLLLFFGAEVSFLIAMSLIFAMYLLVSIVPTIFIFDVVVRGGVAVWLFSFVGLAELIILSTILTMWIFNFVLPSILGSFFVLTFQPATR